jgi:hypothetical protein
MKLNALPANIPLDSTPAGNQTRVTTSWASFHVAAARWLADSRVDSMTGRRTDTVSRRTVGAWLSDSLTASRIGEATNYNTTVRHGMRRRETTADTERR